MLAGKHNLAPISQWVMALRTRSGWQKAAVALANKNARILWALMTQERTCEAAHISERPRPTVSAAA
ncbi:transposase IS116/IS110/IS902 family protein [Comamonas testosteroni]|nr:transposase IS116/IS110/IS902 family protein [Comamonas testosteroni]